MRISHKKKEIIKGSRMRLLYSHHKLGIINEKIETSFCEEDLRISVKYRRKRTGSLRRGDDAVPVSL